MNKKLIGWPDVIKGVLRAVPEFLRPHRLHQLRFIGLNRETKQSIGRVIEYWAEHAPERVALRFEDSRWTYAELNAWINRVADLFDSLRFGPGDSIGILMENRPEVLVCFVAAAKRGVIAGMLNPNQRGDVLRHSIEIVKPKALVVSAECREALESTGFTPSCAPDFTFVWHGGDEGTPAPAGWLDLKVGTSCRASNNPASTATIAAGQPAYYVFTSGTTGLPKASVMTHSRWIKSMQGIGGLALRIRPSDVFYCCLPLYHNNALSISLGSTLSAGATFALDRKFSASRFWSRMRHYEATAFCYIGELLRYLLNRPIGDDERQHKVRLIVGNGLRPEIWEAFERRFGISRIYEFYGSSEGNIAFVNAFGLSQTAGFSPGSFAIVGFDGEIDTAVRHDDGFMKRVDKGEAGLLLFEVSEHQPFDGYTDATATEGKVFRDVFAKGDCWFNTGDLVRDQGLRHIQFVDRVGDTFRWKGENVATGEVEGVLAGLPEIDHGIVYGVSVPDCDGRAGMAAVTLKPDAIFDGGHISQQLQSALPAYAVPLFLRLKPTQETTGTFKYRKVELKQEGFDPIRVADPIYALVDRSRGYEPLTPDVANRIRNGEIRF